MPAVATLKYHRLRARNTLPLVDHLLRGVPLRCRRISILTLAFTTFSATVAAAQEPAGAVIYVQKCARCHGKAGEGKKEVPQPLIGNRSLPQLAKYIAKSMPEDKPGTCTGADAEK